MPFVTQEHRDKPNLDIPGDRCYAYYKTMVDTWHENPSWTTADAIYESLTRAVRDPSRPADMVRAFDLAWQVFFIKHVMKYEDMKAEVNGDI